MIRSRSTVQSTLTLLNRFVSPQRIGTFALLSSVALSSIAPTPNAVALPSPPQQSTQLSQQRQPSTSPRLPRRVARRVVGEIAQRYSIPRRNLTIVQHSRETWSDGCLGLGTASESCLMALTEGWRVEVSSGQQNWVYRTDLMANMIRLEPTPSTSALPADVEEQLRQTIAEDENVSSSAVRVVEVREATWDGCMGIFEADQACTQIAIFGWQVIATDDDRSWVYHLSQDGSRIVQNPTASGTEGGLIPGFIPPGQSDNQGASIVFYSVESGGLAGMMTERLLTSDGVLYRQSGRFNSPVSEPVVEARLSPEQVEQFRQVLLEQRLPNLDQMRYISPASLADYPTITLKGLGSTVEYTDLEMDNLPPALQTVIRTWENL